jgi:hypothetical protein
MKPVFASFMVFLLLASVMSAPAHGLIVTFSFADDNADPLFTRAHVPGTVTGKLHGLVDNANNQLPTAIEITSDISFLGMTDNMIDGDNFLNFWDPTGLDINGGVVTGGGFALNFFDPTAFGTQFRLNGGGYNVLINNTGPGPLIGTGNQDGFAGATYRVGDGSTVPEPATAVLAVFGIGGLIIRRRRRATP